MRAEEDAKTLDQLQAMKPSTASLVRLVQTMVLHVSEMPERLARNGEEMLQARLMFRSLTEDGDFARQLLAQKLSPFMAKLEDCLKAAVAAGNAVDSLNPPKLGGWFTHHLVAMTMVCLLPERPVIDYEVSRTVLWEQLTRFILRGLGLWEAAIARYYHPSQATENAID